MHSSCAIFSLLQYVHNSINLPHLGNQFSFYGKTIKNFSDKKKRKLNQIQCAFHHPHSNSLRKNNIDIPTFIHHWHASSHISFSSFFLSGLHAKSDRSVNNLKDFLENLRCEITFVPLSATESILNYVNNVLFFLLWLCV